MSIALSCALMRLAYFSFCAWGSNCNWFLYFKKNQNTKNDHVKKIIKFLVKYYIYCINMQFNELKVFINEYK